MSKFAFMYKRKDNFRLRNIRPLVTFKLAKLISGYKDLSGELRSPLMIFGCARSGTTTLKEVLSGHSKFAPVPFEANDLWHPALYPWRSTKVSVPPIWVDPFEFTRISNETRTPKDKHALKAIFGSFNRLNSGSMVLLKSAMVAFMIPEMLELVPDMKLIHLHRDGRAVALSLAKKQWVEANKHEDLYRAKGYWLPFDELLDRMAHHWVEHINEIERRDREMGLTASGRMITVSYEDFCAEPEKTAHRIAEFCGLESSGFDIERYADVRATNYKFSKELTEQQLNSITGIMGETLQKLGYSV